MYNWKAREHQISARPNFKFQHECDLTMGNLCFFPKVANLTTGTINNANIHLNFGPIFQGIPSSNLQLRFAFSNNKNSNEEAKEIIKAIHKEILATKHVGGTELIHQNETGTQNEQSMQRDNECGEKMESAMVQSLKEHNREPA